MVKYINYKDEKLPVSISFYALQQLEAEGLELGDENNKDGLKAIGRLFWHSLVAGHAHEGKDLKITEDFAPFVLDECFSDFQEIMPLFLVELTRKSAKKPTVKS